MPAAPAAAAAAAAANVVAADAGPCAGASFVQSPATVATTLDTSAFVPALIRFPFDSPALSSPRPLSVSSPSQCTCYMSLAVSRRLRDVFARLQRRVLVICVHSSTGNDRVERDSGEGRAASGRRSVDIRSSRDEADEEKLSGLSIEHQTAQAHIAPATALQRRRSSETSATAFKRHSGWQDALCSVDERLDLGAVSHRPCVNRCRSWFVSYRTTCHAFDVVSSLPFAFRSTNNCGCVTMNKQRC